jgi:hypothetical protein
VGFFNAMADLPPRVAKTCRPTSRAREAIGARPGLNERYVREWLGRWSPTGLWITIRGTAPTPGLEFVGRDFVWRVPLHVPRAKRNQCLHGFDHHDHHQIAVAKIDADRDAFRQPVKQPPQRIFLEAQERAAIHFEIGQEMLWILLTTP